MYDTKRMPSGAVRTRKAQHVEDTRRALLRAARDRFSERGYQATATEEIVQRAGLTRGALYHHFRDKADLFEAVYVEVADEVNGSLRRRAAADGSTDPWALYRANNEIYLEAASANVAYRQICLIDGPAVFGWSGWSDRQDAEGGMRTISRYVAEAMDAGSLPRRPVGPVTQLLAALGNQAVMYIAHADDPTRAHEEMRACVDWMLGCLEADAPGYADDDDLTRQRKGA